MRQAARTARYDQALGLEAYSLRAVDRPFPSHFHDHYVIGVVERGTRTLTCGRQRQVIGPGDVLLFNPGDSHACIQADGALDYRGLNIPRSTMLALAEEITSLFYHIKKDSRQNLFRFCRESLLFVSYSICLF